MPVVDGDQRDRLESDTQPSPPFGDTSSSRRLPASRWSTWRARVRQIVAAILSAAVVLLLIMICDLLSTATEQVASGQVSQTAVVDTTAPSRVAATESAPAVTPAVITSTTTPRPTAIPTLPRPTPTLTTLSEAQLLAVAQAAVGPSTLRGDGLPGGQWLLRLAPGPDGPQAVVTVPLIQAENNQQFVRLAKKRIALVVSALFAAEPSLAHIEVSGTFPWGGLELPAVTVAVRRSASTAWGNIPVEEFDRVAERIEIKPFYQEP
jgi:hypothetical protein